MPRMFDRIRPDADAVRRVKSLISERFELPETTTLTVAELRCHEPGCPPIETVITAQGPGGRVGDWRIAKPINDITAADTEALDHSSG